MSRDFAWHELAGVSSHTIREEVQNFAGDYAADYDLEGAYEAYCQAIREALPQGASLRGDTVVYDGTWAAEDAAAEISEVIGEVDLTEILKTHDLARLPVARWAAVVVPRGAQLLSAHAGPIDWRARINTGTLNMSTLTSCVLGQLWLGGFREGIEALGLSDNVDDVVWQLDPLAGWRFGFACRPFSVSTWRDYEALKEEWLKILS